MTAAADAKEARRIEPVLETDDVIHVAAFRSMLRLFLRESERIAQANGLTPRRYELLLMIKGAPDASEHATITALAERLQLAQSTATELVKRAEQAGLVVRERSVDDGRVGLLRVSEEGERRLARVVQRHEAEREKLHEMLAALEQITPRRGRTQTRRRGTK